MYYATLTKDVLDTCRFESQCMLTGVVFDSYEVPMPLAAGKRKFKTATKAKAWVEAINAKHGAVAVYNGKQF